MECDSTSIRRPRPGRCATPSRTSPTEGCRFGTAHWTRRSTSYASRVTPGLARESSPGSPFWVVARYDWSEPAVIRWTILESSYGGRGDGSVRIESGDNGGSRLHVEWVNTGARISQRPMLFLLRHGPMGRLISRMWASALDRYAQEDLS